jgi:3D (Asp-Asp-Asp) domain-containing protein
MPARGGNPRITIQADAKPVDQAVDQADKALGRLEKAGMRAGASLRTHVGGASISIGSSLKQGLGGVAALAGIGAVGATVGATLVNGIQGALDAKDINAKLTAQLGLSTKESARLGRVAGKLYASNYGDSMDEVSAAIKSVVTDIDGMRTASSSRLKGITGDVLEVSKAFDQDLGGVTRAVGQLMRTGLAKDAQDALNIVTVGFQAGDDKAGDFLDTLNEYGTQFRKLGIDGKTATGLISQGLKAGARDGDLVADAIKEFSIRAVDGSKTTSAGFKAIGLDAAKMSEQIGKGGPAARKGLDTVLDRLRAIKDPVKQSQAAVALFGTQAEDLGKALYALDPSRAVDGLNKVGGAARKVNNELSNTPKQQLAAFKREMEGLATSAVQKATPALAHAATAVSTFVHGMKDGTGAGGRFAAAITDQVQKVKTAISSWVARNRGDIDSVINAFKTVGKFAKDVFQDTLLPIVKRTFSAIGPIVDGLVHTIRGLVRFVSGLLSGDWDKAWSGAKEAVGGAFKAIKTTVLTAVENSGQWVKDLGPKIIKGTVQGLVNMDTALITGITGAIRSAAKAIPGIAGDALKGIGHAITSGISKGFGALNPFGDGIGITSGLGAAALAGGNGLMGASPILAPFASMAGRFGLHTSSGLRPGAITVSGNKSWHSTGNAIDETGTPAGMLGYFRYMKAKFGRVLRELIYTPGGVGIKDGKPYQYTGAVAAQHNDHVHVAFTGGIGDGDGVGDGLGHFSATSYGPPWGGIQGGGVTATGVNLKGSPHTYGVAVDPRVIPLGSQLKITPNPFSYSGTFTAFDTGGEIKGNRIDFYDWRGRQAQNGWGRRTVSVELVTGSGSSKSAGAKAKTYKPGVSNEPVPSFTITPPEKPDPSSLLVPGAPRTVGGITGALGPAKGGRPIKGFLPGDLPPAEAPEPPEAPDPYDTTLPLGFQAAAALARLTKGTDDDLDADQNAVNYFQGKLNGAIAGGDQQGIVVFANALADATEALNGLKDSIDQANEIQQQRDQLQQTIADNQNKLLALGNRTGDLQAQFAAWLSGSIGGKVGLGFQAAGVPGAVARY